MSKTKSKLELESQKTMALECITDYLTSLLSLGNDAGKKADKLCYWFREYVKFLKYEERLKESRRTMRKYKRGEIIKVQLGFNIGSEEGGLHYAVVISKNDTPKSSVISIIPLVSLKEKKDVTNLYPGEILLGDELFSKLISKTKSKHHILRLEANRLTEEANKYKISSPVDKKKIESLIIELENVNSQYDFISKMVKELEKMKKGSIALVNQITTISKIRIYDPKTDSDVLSDIKLSNETLDDIDKEIKKNFTH